MVFKWKSSIANLIAVLSIFSKFIFTIQQDSCILPDDNRKSTCVRLHHCDHFFNLIKRYNGWPPQDVVLSIQKHACKLGEYVCCPDNVVAEVSSDSSLDDILKNHPNINLINERLCGTSISNRIITDEIQVNELAWAALLGYQIKDELKWSCGGSLISKRFVLTSAHCITNDLIFVRLGERTLSTPIDCESYDFCTDPVQDIKIESKIIHPHYIKSTRQTNDIALIKLESPADTTKSNVKTVCLPTTESSDVENIRNMKLPMIITDDGSTKDIKQRLYIPFINNDECMTKANIEIYKTDFCIGKYNNNDHCLIQSGSGITTIILNNRRPKIVLYGIITGENKCEISDSISPGIFINLKHYLTWILDNITE